MLDLNTSFERPLSKLSENPKKIDIGSTALKLWLLKDVQLQPPLRLINGSVTLCHNLNSVDPISMISQFSESLERYLSNGVIKVEIKVFANWRYRE